MSHTVLFASLPLSPIVRMSLLKNTSCISAQEGTHVLHGLNAKNLQSVERAVVVSAVDPPGQDSENNLAL